MPNVVEHRKFVCTDALNNNNKFWEYKLYDDDTYVACYGRVGKTRTEDPPKPKKDLQTKIREKTSGRGKEGTPTYKPPYKEITIVADAVPTGPTGHSASTIAVKTAAVEQLAKKDVALVNLVTRLVEANKHELYKASGGQMNIDLSTGIISTPVGVITKDSIKDARLLLNDLAPFALRNDFDDKKFITKLNDYLMLVPQQVGHARGWHHHFITGQSDFLKQNTLLDQLDASADLAEARKQQATSTHQQTTIATPSLFNTDLKIITDPKIIAMIDQKYTATLNRMHDSARAGLKPKKYYEVCHQEDHTSFQNDGAKVGNIKLLWHGTRMFNVLSILKNGLVMPNAIATQVICGAMFGNGIYFSDQSSKSLNYAYGYWDRNSRDTNCFMFLADVAMGKEYVPAGSYETLPKKEFDSTYAIGGKSGVMNNEMIVYRKSQANLRYLVEFDSK
jgi:poly [ADP-ribose] polymerase